MKLAFNNWAIVKTSISEKRNRPTFSSWEDTDDKDQDDRFVARGLVVDGYKLVTIWVRKKFAKNFPPAPPHHTDN